MLSRLPAAAFLAISFAVASFGATYTVTKTADTNDGSCDADCSLREAIDRANQTGVLDTILFDAAVFSTPQTINLTLGGDLNITNTLQISGPGARLLTIRQGPGVDRVFDVLPTGGLVILGVSITGGQARNTADGLDGGGLRNAGSLSLIETAVCDNQAAERGGGVYSSGTLNITRSLICRNSAEFNGVAGGGIFVTSGTSAIRNCTISSNLAPFGAGMSTNGGTSNIINTTVASNSGIDASGIFISGAAAIVNIRNSLIGGNAGPRDVDSSGSLFNSNGNNLVVNPRPNIGFTDGVNGDIVGVTPLIGTLGSYGGQTDVHPLLQGSPAIDAGNNCVLNDTCGPVNSATLPTDQRGTGYSRQVSTNVDIGAFEYLVPTAAQVVISGRVMDGTRGIGGAVVTLTAFDGSSMTSVTNPFGHFRFFGVEAGQSVVISTESKRYSFDPFLLNVFDDISELVITPRKPPETSVGAAAEFERQAERSSQARVRGIR